MTYIHMTYVSLVFAGFLNDPRKTLGGRSAPDPPYAKHTATPPQKTLMLSFNILQQFLTFGC